MLPCRLHHTKAGLSDILGLHSVQDGGGLSVCLFELCFFYSISALLCNILHQMQNSLHNRWIFKIHNYLAVTAQAGLKFTYNSSTGLTLYIMSVFDKIQTLE